MTKITPQWISNHFRERDELESFRYKTKYRRDDLEEEKYGQVDYQSYLNQRLNNKAELPTALQNRM